MKLCFFGLPLLLTCASLFFYVVWKYISLGGHKQAVICLNTLLSFCEWTSWIHLCRRALNFETKKITQTDVWYVVITTVVYRIKAAWICVFVKVIRCIWPNSRYAYCYFQSVQQPNNTSDCRVCIVAFIRWQNQQKYIRYSWKLQWEMLSSIFRVYRMYNVVTFNLYIRTLKKMPLLIVYVEMVTDRLSPDISVISKAVCSEIATVSKHAWFRKL